MRNRSKPFVLGILLMFIISACIPAIQAVKIDPTAFQIDSEPLADIPQVCKVAYELAATNRVGVVDFTNNTFGKAVVPQGWLWWREVEMRVPEVVADGVIDELVNIGGVKVFTRTEMEKVLEEHKFQMSGLVDDATLIKVGRLAGLEYIIAGSVNDIGISHTGFVGKEGAITVEIAVRMLDITTGEIIASKRVKGRHLLDSADVIGMTSAIKKASGKALEDLRPVFSKRFTLKGYILQTRTSLDGKERVALVNFGEKQGLKPGSKLFIYTFQEIKDPFTGKSTCDKVRLLVEAEITEQIQEDKAWVMLSGDINQVRRVRAGSLVERAPMEGQHLFKKLGF